MNKINTFLSFVLLSFCLLINVSYAEFNTTPLDDGDAFSASSNIGTNSCGDYTFNQVKKITYNRFVNENDSYIAVFDTMVESLTADGIKLLVVRPKSAEDNYLMFVGNSNISIGAITNTNDQLALYFAQIDSSIKDGEVNRIRKISVTDSSSTYATSVLVDGSPNYGYNTKLDYTIAYSNVDIKYIVFSGGPTWDGTTYFYTTSQNNPAEPENPSLPSNADIAQAVQAFYNSDYYKNNKDFSDFIVMYNYNTKYFSFIGHNFGNKLGQQIIDADIEIGSPPISYNQRWWRYFITGLSEFTSTFFNKYYWLYSTNDLGENINYGGKGSINDLLDLHFSTQSIIVYSTTDYPVNTILKNDNGEAESTLDTISGDQYTYDENLDPTTNEYNPLENFIPTNPSQTILGDVDFDAINQTFEENKDILNIEGASWLFTANNKLVGYFIGFLSLLIVFLIISRILGG